jgi:hypothetical protein
LLPSTDGSFTLLCSLCLKRKEKKGKEKGRKGKEDSTV